MVAKRVTLRLICIQPGLHGDPQTSHLRQESRIGGLQRCDVLSFRIAPPSAIANRFFVSGREARVQRVTIRRTVIWRVAKAKNLWRSGRLNPAEILCGSLFRIVRAPRFHIARGSWPPSSSADPLREPVGTPSNHANASAWIPSARAAPHRVSDPPNAVEARRSVAEIDRTLESFVAVPWPRPLGHPRNIR